MLSLIVILSLLFFLPSTPKKHCLCRCFCWWRWFSILTLFFVLAVGGGSLSLWAQTQRAMSEDVVWVQERGKNIFTNELVLVHSLGVEDEKQIFHFSTEKKKHSITLSPRALVFLSVPLLLLFYYLFYDYLKWPIVKVNDNSERHKIAHSILWLLSIIFLSVINWGWTHSAQRGWQGR